MMDYIVHNLFSTEEGVVWLVLKWILIVAAAGFVGQFGKAFATHLMMRARERRGPGAQSPPGTAPEEAVPERFPALQEMPFPSQPAAEPPAVLKDDKKQVKALAKQQKKLLKKLFK
jgi:hypothetical protein